MVWGRESSGSGVEPDGQRRCPATGKISYDSNKLATRAAIGFKRRKGSAARHAKVLQVFNCPDCGDWHLGNRRFNQNSRKKRFANNEDRNQKGRRRR